LVDYPAANVILLNLKEIRQFTVIAIGARQVVTDKMTLLYGRQVGKIQQEFMVLILYGHIALRDTPWNTA